MTECIIEESLDQGRSFRQIAKYLCKDPSTISKEVWRHRSVNTWNRGSFNNPYNFCIHRFHCKKTNASCIVQKVTAKAGENDIILMHDQYKTTVTAAFEIIDELQAQGYEFVTVEEILFD